MINIIDNNNFMINFEDYKVVFQETEYKDGWYRSKDRISNIKELLETFPLDGPEQFCQVLNYLKTTNERLNKLIKLHVDSKWTDTTLYKYKPDDEKYITENSLFKVLDGINIDDI